ncbi:succinate-semialdehyde dehydrogenase / glutarate-semialdehyde dehydrogenase [Hymenobacter daecheongensis DSM 21074]|uniref:Succinate-semialdehyde dehydrogenase / glutarate-semialdehyde dehydrogenase n=1 Tax=Hymenobacter daecheongensis DSM 21074 TaxID=1121955 RepID=A0A1M6E9Q8_9BACT|nr:NAD-dependent succinate-semialdehyde dehydrogenase [Hymenobacter daecheongensis]SHI82181.1 succinate-semialdehyde dehydrogenase / glutarate-semialdehyde dehydrogenase [Hymenobacter daecheongensis DSM 21074]
MAIESFNPYTGRVLRRFPAFSGAKTERILAQAAKAARTWPQTPFAERARLMHRAAALLRERQDALARLMALEMGKPVTDGRAEIEKCALTCNYYADHAEDFLRDEIIQTAARRSFIAHEPLGVVLAVMPWNFPFWQVVRFAAPALMAGNVGLLKHASNVPQCALALEAIFHDAGFPPATFRTLLIGSDVVEKLIQDDRVMAVTLTGSELAGSKVAAAAGAAIKKTVLELGGSDPFIVLADADLALAAQTAAQARMINAGQSCIAAKRFIVHRSIIKPFISQLKIHLLALRTGDPLDEATQYGPLARPDLADELTQQVEDSVRAGAKVELYGGQSQPGTALFRPMIISNVKPGQRAYAEELFGPVAIILEARDDDDAIRLANDSRFGLGAAIWTQDAKRGEALARRLEAGAVFVNSMVKSSPEMPFGGVKKSGYGRELSHLGIREFVNQKSIWIGGEVAPAGRKKVE